jgi:hypothetical protein
MYETLYGHVRMYVLYEAMAYCRYTGSGSTVCLPYSSSTPRPCFCVWPRPLPIALGPGGSPHAGKGIGSQTQYKNAKDPLIHAWSRTRRWISSSFLFIFPISDLATGSRISSISSSHGQSRVLMTLFISYDTISLSLGLRSGPGSSFHIALPPPLWLPVRQAAAARVAPLPIWRARRVSPPCLPFSGYSTP